MPPINENVTPGPSAGEEIDRGPLNPLQPSDGKIKVGMLLPLTGNPLMTTAQAMKEAAELAVFEKADENFFLIVEDTQGTPTGAVSAFNKVVEQGAELILGPFFSTSVTAITPLAKQRNINVISFSNSTTVATPGIFAFGFSPEQEIFRILNYATAKGLKKFAAVAPHTPYGEVAARMLQEAARRYNAEVVDVVFYKPATDPSEVLKPLNFENIEAILVAEGGKNLAWVISYIEHFRSDEHQVQYLGTRLWENPATLREPTLKGAWFASSSREGWVLFESRFAQAFHKKPPRLATLAYDAVGLAATIAKSPRGADYSLRALTDISGFVGIDGIFRLKQDGTVQRGLAVFNVNPEGFNMISKPSESFL